MHVQLGAAKVAKYATQESGDTLEIIERPHGGLSAVLVDGQRSGRAAKIISNIVARKAIALLGEGVRDGAAARAAHDYLRTHRRGQVSAELEIISIDLETRTLVISRNSHCPVFVVRGDELTCLDGESCPIGIYANTKPVISELELEPGIVVAAFTDGVTAAGKRTGSPLDLPALVCRAAKQLSTAHEMANALLAAALDADQHRPADDTSVLVVAVYGDAIPDQVRRSSMSFPV